MAELRLLIAVGESAEDIERLPPGVGVLIRAAERILVIAPRLPGRLEWLSSATDKASAEADRRLQKVLGQLEELGADAEGELGADDPLLAFEDALARFPANHILVGLRREDNAGWQESGLLGDLPGRLGIPLTLFELRS